VWTPKRVVLLVLGFAAFLAAYLLYGWRLGGIDGLPPLPEAYWPSETSSGQRPLVLPPRLSSVDQKLRQAFGPGVPELGWPIKIEFRARNMLLAAGQCQIEAEGRAESRRVRLAPVSIALFSKDRGDGRPPEINTVRGQVAVLTLDRPVSNYFELGNRKVVAAELTGNIEITNNRRTPARDDDLSLTIPHGPLFYDETKHLLWTEDRVRLQDDSSRPDPILIKGKGMELELAVEARPGSSRRAKNEAITGVHRILLKEEVDMHLYVDAGSSFLNGRHDAQDKSASPDKAKELVGPPAPPEKAHVHIKTDGPFRYEFGKDSDLAHFDVPKEDPARPLLSPKDVTVTRYHRSLGKADQLVCRHLELRVRRKEGAKAAGARDDASLEQGLDVESAHATGKLVALASDTEELVAEGDDFFFDARLRLTILKGAAGVEVKKQGNDCSHLRARELQIQEQKAPAVKGMPAKTFQHVTALGPGRIDLLDKELLDQKVPVEKSVMHAIWNDKLVSTRDGAYDLMVLTGAAAFVDDEHNQTLKGETLKVWLDRKDQDGSVVPGQTTPQQARRPHHLQATGNVSAKSSEMYVHNTGRLVIWFRDLPPGGVLPKELPGAGAPLTVIGENGHVAGKLPAPAPIPVIGAPPAAPAPAPAPAPPRPFDLEARSVEAWVVRSDVREPGGKTESKNTLETLRCEGMVHVRQDPAKPEEKGVDVTGDTLLMKCRPEGNNLIVTGDLARLQMDQTVIWGTDVNIDQADNRARVNGAGAMQMESKTNFQGEELKKPVPLTVYWGQGMDFQGQWAVFWGGSQAYQENAQMLCQGLQVYFDRPISLKEGNKSAQPARVQKLMCDKSVVVEEQVLEGNKLVKYQRLLAAQMGMETLEKEDGPAGTAVKNAGNVVTASGPGEFRVLQRGGGPETAGPPRSTPSGSKPAASKKPAKPAEPEMKLTCVFFLTRMFANSRSNRAVFIDNVRVVHVPSEDPKLKVDPDAPELPKGGLYLRSDWLEVQTIKPEAPGKPYQIMTAKNHVFVQSQEFYARADKMHYDESKDQIILEGGDNSVATLYKIRRPGERPQEFKGKKITYVRQTGAFKTDDGRWLDGESN
jgi:lipopolysaccharide export system protein LptA